MAFQFSGGNIVQPASFGEMMGGFKGPIDAKAAGFGSFSDMLAQEKAARDSLMGLGIQEAASTGRTKENNRTAVELQKINNKHSDDSSKRTAMQALALAPRLAGNAGGFAGQAFGIGVGAEGNSTQRMATELGYQNQILRGLADQRELIGGWSEGSRRLGVDILNRMPGQPATFGA